MASGIGKMEFEQTVQETFIRTLLQGQASQPKDVQVIVGNQTFHCHKQVLSIWSDYFRAAFESGMKEEADKRVTLSADDIVTIPAFQQLYDVMYSAKLELTEYTVYPLITASHYLRMPTVIVLCTSFLKENAAGINQDLALQLANFQADDLAEFRTSSLNKLAENFASLLSSEKMLRSLSVDSLSGILQSEHLKIHNEAELLSTILKWMTYDGERPKHADSLLKHVRLGLIAGLDLLPALDTQYMPHLTTQGPIIREILASKLDKSKEEGVRNLYPDMYKPRALVNLAESKEVLASLAPNRKMLVFTQECGWQFAETKLPKSRSNFLSVGSSIYMVTPSGMLSRYEAETKKWEKISRVPFSGLYTGPMRIVHHHPYIYIIQGRYNAYYDHHKGVWGQMCPLPASTSLGYWKEEVIQAGDVMADGRVIVSWNCEKDTVHYVSSAVYDPKTNQWTQLANVQFDHKHYIISHEKATFLLKQSQVYNASEAGIPTAFYFNSSSWYSFNFTFHVNNVGALVNPLTGKDILVTFGGVVTPTGMQKNQQGYFSTLDEEFLKLNPDNGFQVTTGTGEDKITAQVIIKDASVLYLPRELCF